MSDKFNETIQDIAVRHGVILGKDDPILILQTMNDRLLVENRKTQQEMLAQFREEMENISSQWRDDAKEKAEKILNAALESGKDAMTKLLQEATDQSVQVMKKMITDALAEANNLVQQTRKFSRIILWLSGGALIGVGLLLLIFSILV